MSKQNGKVELSFGVEFRPLFEQRETNLRTAVLSLKESVHSVKSDSSVSTADRIRFVNGVAQYSIQYIDSDIRNIGKIQIKVKKKWFSSAHRNYFKQKIKISEDFKQRLTAYTQNDINMDDSTWGDFVTLANRLLQFWEKEEHECLQFVYSYRRQSDPNYLKKAATTGGYVGVFDTQLMRYYIGALSEVIRFLRNEVRVQYGSETDEAFPPNNFNIEIDVVKEHILPNLRRFTEAYRKFEKTTDTDRKTFVDARINFLKKLEELLKTILDEQISTTHTAYAALARVENVIINEHNLVVDMRKRVMRGDFTETDPQLIERRELTQGDDNESNMHGYELMLQKHAVLIHGFATTTANRKEAIIQIQSSIKSLRKESNPKTVASRLGTLVTNELQSATESRKMIEEHQQLIKEIGVSGGVEASATELLDHLSKLMDAMSVDLGAYIDELTNYKHELDVLGIADPRKVKSFTNRLLKFYSKKKNTHANNLRSEQKTLRSLRREAKLFLRELEMQDDPSVIPFPEASQPSLRSILAFSITGILTGAALTAAQWSILENANVGGFASMVIIIIAETLILTGILIVVLVTIKEVLKSGFANAIRTIFVVSPRELFKAVLSRSSTFENPDGSYKDI